MQTLILLRHGEAIARTPSGADADRALSAGGRAAASAAGRALCAAGVAPDRVLVSAALRTRQTWEAASSAWPGLEALELAELYNASAKTLLERAGAERAAAVMLVGHNPGLHDLAASLTPDPRAHREFPPASTAVFDRSDGGWTLRLWRVGSPR